jgi:DNA-binding CsgD family transcriptional regulator
LRVRAIEYYADHAHENLPDPYGDLTERERDDLSLTAVGLDKCEIAAQLSLSPWTVEGHLLAVMHKMGFRSSVDLVRYATERGIVHLPGRGTAWVCVDLRVIRTSVPGSMRLDPR